MATPNSTCGVCGAQFARHGTMTRHEVDVHVGTTCHWPGCNYQVPATQGITLEDREILLVQHLDAHNDAAHQEAMGGEQPRTICWWPGCGKTLARKSEVRRHIKIHNKKARDGQQ